MRPELLQEYEQIVMEYRQENWGIYDDTPDLHRAIAWSDAYYGDQSSVEVLFHAAGKPVMQQEIDDLPLVFENFIQVDNDYWFTAFNLNVDNRTPHSPCTVDGTIPPKTLPIQPELPHAL